MENNDIGVAGRRLETAGQQRRVLEAYLLEVESFGLRGTHPNVLLVPGVVLSSRAGTLRDALTGLGEV